jgi:hypothetical protein
VRGSFSRRCIVALAACAVGLASATVGNAYWTAHGAGTLNQTTAGLTSPSPSATSPTAGTAHVAWSAVTLSPDVPALDPEVTYVVQRKLAAGSTWSSVCGTGTTPKPYNVLSCDDSPPAAGDYDFRVIASFRTWTSQGTSAVHVVVDTTAPTSTITFPGSGSYDTSGWTAGCSSSICGSASDAGGSGLQKVELSVRRGSGNYWNGSSFASASQVWNVATGTSSWAYSFAAGNLPADGAYTVEARATDDASNVQSPATARTFTYDTTAPTVSLSEIAAATGTSPVGFVKQGGAYIVYADASDANGVNAVTADVSTVTTGQIAVALPVCASGCTVGGHTYGYKSATLTASSPLSEGSASFAVWATDLASNASTPLSDSVQVDNSAPSVAAVVANTTTGEPGWLAQASGYRVYANVTELPSGAGASSGLNSSSITADVSNVTTGQTAVSLSTSGCPCTVGGTTYAYRSDALTANATLTAGSTSFTTSASDNLGSTTSQSGSVTVDNTAPALSTLQMFDVDADGKVDQVKATFAETLETYSAGTTPWTLANAPGGSSNTLSSVSVATTIATLTLDEGTVNTAAGSFTVALASNASGIRDLAGNRSSFSATSVADKAAPIPTNVVLSNVSTLGRVRATDFVTLTYSETMDAAGFCSTWTNGSTQTLNGSGQVVVTITDAGSADTLTVATTTGCAFNLGTIGLAANYVGSTTTFSGSSSNASVLTWNPSAKTLTITLGAGNGSQTGVAASTPTYTASSSLRDLASPANTMSATAFAAPATSRF